MAVARFAVPSGQLSRVVPLLSALVVASAAAAQQNLGFEQERDGAAPGWSVGGEGFEVRVDPATFFEGARSLRLSRTAQAPPGQNEFAVAGQFIDAARLDGEVVRLTAAMRTRGVAVGYAGLWLRFDGPQRELLYLDNMSSRPVRGTTDWQRYELTAPLPEGVERVAFGALLPGSGTAWVDAFEIDAVRYDELPPPPSDVAEYVESALDLIQEHSIRRGDVDWEAFRAATLVSVRGIETVGQSHAMLQAALQRLGDRHSHLIPPARAAAMQGAGAASGDLPWREPQSHRLSATIGYVSVPAYVGTNPQRMTRFADALQSAIAAVDSAEVCGWVVDLRRNGGGNVFPMIAGIGPIAGEGDLGGGVRADGTEHRRWYRDGRAGTAQAGQALGGGDAWAASVSGDPYRLHDEDPAVAVLIGSGTASSGEATALAFVGRPHTRIFGRPTAGLTTGNFPFALSDGALLNLAVSVMTDRIGRTYPGPIEPDVYVQESDADLPLAEQRVVQQAVAWLNDGHCG